MEENSVQNISKTKAWIKAMRLRTLPLSFSVILMGNAIAQFIPIIDTVPASSPPFSWPVFVLTLLTTLFLQVLSNFANDYGDAQKGADNEDRIGPERTLQSGALTAKEMRFGIGITIILCLTSGVGLLFAAFGTDINLQFILFFVFGILAIGAAIKYTMGKGAYGYFALGDLFVFLFFGVLGVCGSFYLQEHEFDWFLLLPASQMGFLSVAVLNLNNMRDRINDQKVGKKTLAVILGFKGSKNYHMMLFLFAWVPFIILNTLLVLSLKAYFFGIELLLFFGPIMVFHFLHLRRVMKVEDPKDYDPELKKIALSTFLFGLIAFMLITLS